MLSATVAGLVGGVWFLYLTQVQPPSGFDPLFDLSLVLMSFLGGLGTVSGPVLGALIVEPGQLYLTITYTNGYVSEILLGALLLVVVLFVPRGLIPTAGEWIKKIQTRGRPAVSPASQRPPALSGLRSEELATSDEGRQGLKGGRRRAGEEI